MDFLEKDLEQIIFEADNDELEDRGLNLDGNKLRQVRIGNYGIADLITYSFLKRGWVKVQVCEFKRHTVDCDTLMQATRYVSGLRSYLSKRYPSTYFEFSIVLVGRAFEKQSNFLYLCNFISENLKGYTYDYQIDGIFFNELGIWQLRDEGFNKVNY